MEKNPKKKLKPRGKPFQGALSNPNGRPPKGMTLTDIAIEYGEDCVGFDNLGRPVYRKQQFVQKCWNHAEEGNPTFAKMIWEQTAGAPKQNITNNVINSGEINIKKLNTEELKLLRDLVEKIIVK